MSTGRVPTIVSTKVQFHLVMPGDHRVPVSTILDYSADEPYSVRATFQTGEESVSWVFARDLLAAGRKTAAGTGDISVWPATHGGDPVVCLSLSSPSGQAMLHADLADIDAFLDRSFAVVPAGTESELVDIDGLIERIMDADAA